MTSADVSARRRLLMKQRLRQRREQLGLAQKQAANRIQHLGIPLTNKSLSALEHGATVDVTRLPVLASALECSVTYLLGLTTDPRR